MATVHCLLSDSTAFTRLLEAERLEMGSNTCKERGQQMGWVGVEQQAAWE
jgi:hypothetical protein